MTQKRETPYNKRINLIKISNQETDKFLNQTHSIVQIVYFTDFNKQLFISSTCFDLHFETVILTTSTQQKSVTQKHTHLVEVTQDRKEMSHFPFTQTHTYKRKVVLSPIGDIVQLYFYIFVLFRFVSPMKRRDTWQF
jgi:hypothetical protein